METRMNSKMGRLTKEEFQKKYPNLSKELGEAGTVKIDAVRSFVEEAEKVSTNANRYSPNIVTLIRKCKKEIQALEIINFLETKGEIKPKYAKQLRKQLVEMGLRSFGKIEGPHCHGRGK